jgi:hypothetical protein
LPDETSEDAGALDDMVLTITADKLCDFLATAEFDARSHELRARPAGLLKRKRPANQAPEGSSPEVESSSSLPSSESFRPKSSGPSSSSS